MKIIVILRRAVGEERRIFFHLYEILRNRFALRRMTQGKYT